MLGSLVREFSDPDEFAASVRAANVQFSLTGRGNFAAKIVRVDLHRLWLQRFADNLPRVAHVSILPGRAIFSFCAGSSPAVMHNGLELTNTVLRRSGKDGESYELSAGRAVSGAMSLPVADLAAVVMEMAGCDLSPPPHGQIVTPPPAALASLQRSHAAAGYLAEHAPGIIANPEAARGLEQELIQSLVACLAPRDAGAGAAGSRSHNRVMRRFRMMLEANPDRAIHVPELCKAIGVSGRLLRACCHEYLGMGPSRYLWLRRMHLARRGLALADPSAATVTDVATAHGFWELGRFAVEYRKLFDESPSSTLRRPRAIH